MIDATRIEQPEVERPDLYVVVSDEASSTVRGYYTSLAMEEEPMQPAEGRMFLLPGTRREKLTKALMEALAEWHRLRHSHTEIGYVDAIDRLEDAYSNLLALDAEGVKP